MSKSKINIDFSDWILQEEKLDKFFDDNNLNKLLEQSIFFIEIKILERTAASKDIDGDDFKKYSTRYKQYRLKKGLPSVFPDLFFTGDMLGALTHTIKNKKAKLFFSEGIGSPSPDDKELYNNEPPPSPDDKASYNNKLRPFFGFNNKEEKIAVKIITDAFDKGI